MAIGNHIQRNHNLSYLEKLPNEIKDTILSYLLEMEHYSPVSSLNLCNLSVTMRDYSKTSHLPELRQLYRDPSRHVQMSQSAKQLVRAAAEFYRHVPSVQVDRFLLTLECTQSEEPYNRSGLERRKSQYAHLTVMRAMHLKTISARTFWALPDKNGLKVLHSLTPRDTEQFGINNIQHINDGRLAKIALGTSSCFSKLFKNSALTEFKKRLVENTFSQNVFWSISNDNSDPFSLERAENLLPHETKIFIEQNPKATDSYKLMNKILTSNGRAKAEAVAKFKQEISDGTFDIECFWNNYTHRMIMLRNVDEALVTGFAKKTAEQFVTKYPHIAVDLVCQTRLSEILGLLGKPLMDSFNNNTFNPFNDPEKNAYHAMKLMNTKELKAPASEFAMRHFPVTSKTSLELMQINFHKEGHPFTRLAQDELIKRLTDRSFYCERQNPDQKIIEARRLFNLFKEEVLDFTKAMIPSASDFLLMYLIENQTFKNLVDQDIIQEVGKRFESNTFGTGIGFQGSDSKISVDENFTLALNAVKVLPKQTRAYELCLSYAEARILSVSFKTYLEALLRPDNPLKVEMNIRLLRGCQNKTRVDNQFVFNKLLEFTSRNTPESKVFLEDLHNELTDLKLIIDLSHVSTHQELKNLKGQLEYKLAMNDFKIPNEYFVQNLVVPLLMVSDKLNQNLLLNFLRKNMDKFTLPELQYVRPLAPGIIDHFTNEYLGASYDFMDISQ